MKSPPDFRNEDLAVLEKGNTEVFRRAFDHFVGFIQFVATESGASLDNREGVVHRVFVDFHRKASAAGLANVEELRHWLAETTVKTSEDGRAVSQGAAPTEMRQRIATLEEAYVKAGRPSDFLGASQVWLDVERDTVKRSFLRRVGDSLGFLQKR